MKYSDGRFGRHPRWRFFIFNTIIRRKAPSSARYYVSKSSGLKYLDCEELSEALKSNTGLLPQIVRQGAALPGTRPFWKSKGGALQAIARFNTPHISPVFITFSCTDIQWHDLHRHLPNYADFTTGDERQRRNIIWENVQANPHTIAFYLDLRFKAFLRLVVKPHFRGSGMNLSSCIRLDRAAF
jgi:hypothetical protein